MTKTKIGGVLSSILLGNRYNELINISDQIRYMTMNAIFMVAIFPLVLLGITMIGVDLIRTSIDFGIAFLCLASLILIRTKVPLPLSLIPVFPVSVFGAYCLYLLYTGQFNLWAAVWLLAFPLIVVFLCKITIGIIESVLVLGGIVFILYSPIMPVQQDFAIRVRVVIGYFLVMSLAVIYEYISIKKDQKEKLLNTQLAQERDIIQTMKDNINQGIFMMNSELKILPQYSRLLITIFSYYDEELAGKNFLDIIAQSLDAKQLQIMKDYFSMIFSKSKSKKVLESANPISEFEYKIDDRTKTLITRFNLVEQGNSEPVIIGIVEDITREKEFERELQTQKETRELEMKNIFDVIQIDPLVFHDFIDDTESNFNFINLILKDRTLTEKQVVTKFLQNVHAMKSNALILGLESFGNKLHALEDDIKAVSSLEYIAVDDVLVLAFKLEKIMQEKDAYLKITKKVEAFKSSNQIDTILIHSLTKAVEKFAGETQKRVELKAEQVDLGVLETGLRRPIKDILLQCIRNSIYHGIEPVDERIKKNKKPLSLLVFSIKNVDGNAEITFSDDGCGLDWDKIKTRYLALHPETKQVNKTVLTSAIFSPEFSTAGEANNVAGRGVGLSLVKDLVKENNGTIKVDSSEAGLTFKFVLPLAS